MVPRHGPALMDISSQAMSTKASGGSRTRAATATRIQRRIRRRRLGLGGWLGTRGGRPGQTAPHRLSL
jgi:hypothetical protein